MEAFASERVVTDERVLTEIDHLRLSRLLHRSAAATADERTGSPIAALLDAAVVVAPHELGADVATMHSRVLLSDPRTARQRALTLCYPAEADPAAGLISVLSPVGASLLGLRIGATACWRAPTGEVGEARLLAILFQPEASGDYTL